MSSHELEITRLLEAAHSGDRAALDRLIPEVYGELRSIAGALLSREAEGATLQPTALVHELWVRLAAQDTIGARHRSEFFRAAATAMRRVLVDRARARGANKRVDPRKRVPLDELVENLEQRAGDLGQLDEALAALGQVDDRKARLVELRFFTGLDVGQAAEALGVSKRMAERDWTVARAWLRSYVIERSNR